MWYTIGAIFIQIHDHQNANSKHATEKSKLDSVLLDESVFAFVLPATVLQNDFNSLSPGPTKKKKYLLTD